jgi:disulfide bond formation protein DsbB
VNEVVDSTLAALAILAQISAVVVVALIVAVTVNPRARASFAGSWTTLSRQAVWLAWGVAAVATIGSLYFSEIADYLPCRLCWYQRIAMYPLAVVLLVGALLRDRRVTLYAAAFPLIGAAISIYHIYIEVNPEAESAACRAGVPCSTRWIDEFGYVTIPVMALSGFVLIGALLVLAAIAGKRARQEESGAEAPPA